MTHHPDASTSSHDLREAVARDNLERIAAGLREERGCGFFNLDHGRMFCDDKYMEGDSGHREVCQCKADVRRVYDAILAGPIASELARLTERADTWKALHDQQVERLGDEQTVSFKLEADVARLTGERDEARELAGLTWTAPDVDAVGRWAEEKGATGIRDRMNRLFRRAANAEERVRQLLNEADRCGQDHQVIADEAAEARALAAEAELATLKAAAARDAEERVRLSVAAREYQSASGYLIGQYIRLHEGKPSHDLPEAHAWSASAADALALALTKLEKTDG
jgi:hypothetical protein